MWEYRATCLEVLDGDTLRLLVDTGFYGRAQVDVRLLDVSAPELSQPGGVPAKEYVESWVRSLPLAVWPILVRTQTTTTKEPSEIRSFTRYVGEIMQYSWTGNNLNELVRAYVEGWSA